MVIVSTTGDGDPPDNVARFWRRLRRKALSSDHLAGCNYALLGELATYEGTERGGEGRGGEVEGCRGRGCGTKWSNSWVSNLNCRTAQHIATKIIGEV